MKLTFTRITVSRWNRVPQDVVAKGQEWLIQAKKILHIVEGFPVGKDSQLWWNPGDKRIWLNEGDADAGDHKQLVKKLEALDDCVDSVEVADEARPPKDEGWLKLAMSPRSWAEGLQFIPAAPGSGMPSSPSPLTSALAGGLLGAGVGYGAGWLGETLLPQSWERRRLRQTLTRAGAALGAAPGLIWGLVNAANGHGPLSGYPFNTQSEEVPTQTWAAAGDTVVKEAMAPLRYRTSMLDGPPVNVNKFNDVVWNDPYVANQLTPQMQAAASGVVLGASQLAGDGNQARYVTPADLARFSVGMGSGYLSGALLGSIAGKVLGAPESVQDTLKQTGVFAGLLTNLVPRIFGGN